MNIQPPERGQVIKRGCAFLVLLLLLSLVFSLGILIQVSESLLFGWITYLRRVLPRISFNAEIATNATVALTLATLGLHGILVWWTRSRGDGKSAWRFGWTLKITLMVLLLFATSIAATGIVHQVGWLARADRLTYDASQAYLSRDMAEMRRVAIALREYEKNEDGKFPPDLESLVPEYVESRAELYSSINEGEPPQQYLYFPAHQGTGDPANFMILASPSAFNGKRAIAFWDTSTKLVKEAEFQALLSGKTDR
jgi:hypothetical protein